MACSGDRQDNLERTLAGIERAASGGARWVVLQELFRSPYFCRTLDEAHFELAEPVPGPTTEALRAAARNLKVGVLGSVFERRAPGLYHNTAVAIDAAGRVAGAYRKMHIPEDPGFTGEVLLYTRRRRDRRRNSARVCRVRSRGSAHRPADLLGPVVPRGRAGRIPAGGRVPRVPDGDRATFERE